MLRKSGPLSVFHRPRFDFYAGGAKLCLGHETKLMGVLNVTPDSFSGGGFFMDPALAEVQAIRMQEEGAHLIDIGGESSRPGSKPISAREEIRRIRPVLKRLSRKIQVPLSVDTTKVEVAQMSLEEGALVINDICALRGGKHLAKLIARYKAGVVLMHMRGNPETMQNHLAYRDLLKEIKTTLEKAVRFALDAGIPKQSIVVDPGFGFGKSTEQNFEILKHLDLFASLKCPVLAGLSRKSFVGEALQSPVSDRLYASLGAAAVAIRNGAHILRVHDVLPHKHLASLVDRTMRN